MAEDESEKASDKKKNLDLGAYKAGFSLVEMLLVVLFIALMNAKINLFKKESDKE